MQYEDGQLTQIDKVNQYIKPLHPITQEMTMIHGVTNQMVQDAPTFVEYASQLVEWFQKADIICAHNYDFDRRMIEGELLRVGRSKVFAPDTVIDTMIVATDVCQISNGRGGYKYPKLDEVYRFFFGEGFDHAHNAWYDVLATVRVLQELIRRGCVTIENEYEDQASLF